MIIPLKPEWQKIRIEDIVEFVIGGDWGKAPDYESEEYIEAYCIRGAEFKNWETDKGKTSSLRKIKKTSLKKRTLKPNDILVEISGGGPEQPVGRTVLIDDYVLSHFGDQAVICTNFLRLLRTKEYVDSNWLNKYLGFFYKSGEVVKYQAGSNNLRNLKFKDYLSIEFPLPPLPEQRTIVSKIEQLFSELDAGIAHLKKAQAQLKIYRQAVLKKAFEGELTKEWRAKQSNLPTAEELLAQIKTERAQHHTQQLADWEQAVKTWETSGKEGKKPTKPKKLKEVAPLSEEELKALPILPGGWNWKKLGELTQSIFDGPFGSNLKTSDYVSSGVRVIRLENIGHLSFISNKFSFITDTKYKTIKKHTVYPKDIIFSSFIADRISVTSIPQDIKFAVNKADCFCVRFNDYSFYKYFEYFLSTPVTYNQLINQVHGATRPRVNTTQLKEVQIPLCSLSEQNQIVQEIESRLSVCDQVETSIAEGLQKAEALRQSILKKAFEGQLLSEAELQACKNEKDWEPARELLERIKR